MTQADLAVKTKVKLKQPSLYKVVLLNDDFTPMDFVIQILNEIYGLERLDAVRVTMEIHNDGRGVCGTYTKEIAETKVFETTAVAKQYGYPLKAIVEKG